MADEDNVVVESSGAGSGGLIQLVTLLLVVISIGISAFSMITVVGLKKELTAEIEAEEEEVLAEEVSVTDIDTFAFTEGFTFMYNDVNEPKSNKTVVVDISVGILSTKETEEEALDLMTLISDNETIVRDGLESLMTMKTFEDFQTEEGQSVIKADIIKYLQKRLETDLIIDVYFNNYISVTS